MSYIKCLIGILFFFVLSAYSQHISGRVVGITDGDTFKILTNDSTLVIVRLAHIDCPERKQAFSQRAKQFVSDAIFGKVVVIEELKKDRYKRSVANVLYGKSLNLSKELLKQGLAWHYKAYSKDPELQSLEDQAKAKKIGLWQDLKPIPPWEWRSHKRK